MDNALRSTLIHIAQALNSSDILWSVGASVLLHQYGLVDSPVDLDITVLEADIHTADKILSAMGDKQPEKDSDIYSTDFFYEYNIDGIAVDVMSGFKINLSDGVFSYQYDKQSVADSFGFDGTKIPFSSLEDWYVLYQMMPQKEEKVNLIEDFFKKNGLIHPYLLNRIADTPLLPVKVKKRVQDLTESLL